jgi:arginine repressor
MTIVNVRGQAPEMDRVILEEQLRLTKIQCALGNEQIARQRELISLLEQAGKDATAANQLLKHLEKLKGVFVAEAWKLSVHLASIQE